MYVRYGIGEEEHTCLKFLTGKGMGSIGRFLLFLLRSFFDLAGVASFHLTVYMLGNFFSHCDFDKHLPIAQSISPNVTGSGLKLLAVGFRRCLLT